MDVLYIEWAMKICVIEKEHASGARYENDF